MVKYKTFLLIRSAQIVWSGTLLSFTQRLILFPPPSLAIHLLRDRDESLDDGCEVDIRIEKEGVIVALAIRGWCEYSRIADLCGEVGVQGSYGDHLGSFAVHFLIDVHLRADEGFLGGQNRDTVVGGQDNTTDDGCASITDQEAPGLAPEGSGTSAEAVGGKHGGVLWQALRTELGVLDDLRVALFGCLREGVESGRRIFVEEDDVGDLAGVAFRTAGHGDISGDALGVLIDVVGLREAQRSALLLSSTTAFHLREQGRRPGLRQAAALGFFLLLVSRGLRIPVGEAVQRRDTIARPLRIDILKVLLGGNAVLQPNHGYNHHQQNLVKRHFRLLRYIIIDHSV